MAAVPAGSQLVARRLARHVFCSALSDHGPSGAGGYGAFQRGLEHQHVFRRERVGDDHGDAAGPGQMFVTSGVQAMSAPLVMAGNLSIDPPAGTTLTISGNISQASPGMALSLDGPGTLVLSGTNSYSGGTAVNAGTLIVSTRRPAERNGLVGGRGRRCSFRRLGAFGFRGGCNAPLYLRERAGTMYPWSG